MGLARHRRQRKLASERLVGRVVHCRQHIVEDDGKGVRARVHRRNDLRFMRFRLHQPLGEGVGQPLQLLVGTVLRAVENGLLLAIEEFRATTIGLRHEGVEEVRKLLGVFIGDRMLHAARLELFCGGGHFVPGLGTAMPLSSRIFLL